MNTYLNTIRSVCFSLAVTAAVFPSYSYALPEDCDVTVSKPTTFAEFQNVLDSSNDRNGDKSIKICLDAKVSVVNAPTSKQKALVISKDDTHIYAGIASGVVFRNERTDGFMEDHIVFTAATYVHGLRFSNLEIETSGIHGYGLRFIRQNVIDELVNLKITTKATGSNSHLSAIQAGGGSRIKKIDMLALYQTPGTNVMGISVYGSAVDSIQGVFAAIPLATDKYGRVTVLHGHDASFGTIEQLYINSENPGDIGANFFNSHIGTIKDSCITLGSTGVAVSDGSVLGSLARTQITSRNGNPVALFSGAAIELIDECELKSDGDEKYAVSMYSAKIRGIRFLKVVATGRAHPLGGNGVRAFDKSKVVWVLNYKYDGPGKSVWADNTSSVGTPVDAANVVQTSGPLQCSSCAQTGSCGCVPPTDCTGPGMVVQGCSCVYVGCKDVVCPVGSVLDPQTCQCLPGARPRTSPAPR